MARQNLFEGDSYRALFAKITYSKLMSHKWVTYADIMADYLGKKSPSEFPCNLSNCDNYGELKKAFGDVKHAIIERIGGECFEEYGNNRNKRYRYIGHDNDPLNDMVNAKVINDLKQYFQFCQDSAGFFPSSWLDYFFKDSRDLLRIQSRRRKGEEMLSASVDRVLKGIELLPALYEWIQHNQVLSIDYEPYCEQKVTLIFHPQYLKEFNGRWYLFGHTDDKEPHDGHNLAIDRIIGKPREKAGIAYVPPAKGYYRDFFQHIVGVSHTKENTDIDIVLRAHTYYAYKLIETKPFHSSQSAISTFAEHQPGKTYGDFSLHLEVNNEFIGRILQLGDGIEIISPGEVREIFKNRIMSMAKRYNQT